MPELSTFLDREDEQELVQFILAHGGRLVGDIQSSLDYQIITDLDEFTSVRNHERLFFILFDSYVKSPLKLCSISGGHFAGKYSIVPRVGGPAIDLLGSVEYCKEGSSWISGGGLSYYPTYENTFTGELEKPPEALVKQYTQIVSLLKGACNRVEGSSGRKYFIGPHTYQRISDGYLQLAVKGLQTDFSDPANL